MNEELGKNLRENLVEVVFLWSENSRVENYKNAVPFVNITIELIATWDANFLPERKWFRDALKQDELETLAKIDRLIKGLDKRKLKDVPGVFTNSDWKLIQREMREYLSVYSPGEEW